MNQESEKQLEDLRIAQLNLWRWIHQLQAGEKAFRRLLGELEPLVSPEIFFVLLKYEVYKVEESQKLLLAFEKFQPGFAAEIDKGNPIVGMPPQDFQDDLPGSS